MDPADLEMKPAFPVGRIVGGIVWTIVSVGIAWVWAAIVSYEHAHPRYCTWDPNGDWPCWPTFAQNLGANLERWSWAVGVFVFFTTPVWLSLVVWTRQRRRRHDEVSHLAHEYRA